VPWLDSQIPFARNGRIPKTQNTILKPLAVKQLTATSSKSRRNDINSEADSPTNLAAATTKTPHKTGKQF